MFIAAAHPSQRDVSSGGAGTGSCLACLPQCWNRAGARPVTTGYQEDERAASLGADGSSRPTPTPGAPAPRNTSMAPGSREGGGEAGAGPTCRAGMRTQFTRYGLLVSRRETKATSWCLLLILSLSSERVKGTAQYPLPTPPPNTHLSFPLGEVCPAPAIPVK